MSATMTLYCGSVGDAQGASEGYSSPHVAHRVQRLVRRALALPVLARWGSNQCKYATPRYTDGRL